MTISAAQINPLPSVSRTRSAWVPLYDRLDALEVGYSIDVKDVEELGCRMEDPESRNKLQRRIRGYGLNHGMLFHSAYVKQFNALRIEKKKPAPMHRRQAKPSPELENLISKVCRDFRLVRAELVGNQRTERLIFPRHLLWWTAVHLGGFSSNQVKLQMGLGSGTVLNGLRSFQNRIDLQEPKAVEWTERYRQQLGPKED